VAVPCFDLLDRHVIGGRADAVALVAGPTTWTYARLLEEVSAFGGVLRHCGVAAGDPVGIALPESTEAVVAVLACGRIGARPVLDPGAGEAAVLVTDSAETELLRTATAGVVLVKQRTDAPWELREDRDYDWDVVMRAGRTDPAPCLETATLEPPDERVRAWVDALLAGLTVELA